MPSKRYALLLGNSLLLRELVFSSAAKWTYKVLGQILELSSWLYVVLGASLSLLIYPTAYIANIFHVLLLFI